MSKEPTNDKVEELLSQMTLEEKVGQLNFIVGDALQTGPASVTNDGERLEMIKSGKVTGVFNAPGAEFSYKLQKLAVENSRLGIPLLFGADIIHGYKTIFPIPLAEAASWDLETIENGARVAAKEATSAGINFNFAPMVDVGRDARWGRNAEGAGEDPYLGSLIARARVRGFQGNDLAAPYTLAACVKHFAAYGAPEGGKEYNTVDMSERVLREMYLPPYRAAIDEGAATVMTSFNEIDGVPASGSKYLLDDILRKEWGFNGMVVSDYNSITEMINHGVVGNRADAAKMALESGNDMDMMGLIYSSEIEKLVKEGKLSEETLDKAVRRVLKLKYDLGLFENPYLYADPAVEKKEVRSKENYDAALDMAKRSIVLLKNEKDLLPINKNVNTIALIGPLAENKDELNGMWSFFGENQDPISILEGIKQKVGPGTKILTADGADFYSDSRSGFSKAVGIANKADVVILALGESAVMSGEAASRSSIELPGVQKELMQAIQKTGKPIVTLVSSGRPLAISWMDKNIPAILQTWSLGTLTGPAIAEVLFGDYNPSGKLPMTFPRNVGQVPIYYNHKNTGRPYTGDYSEPASDRIYSSRYRDVENSPLYPFGYGLSYAKFEYSDIQLDKASIKSGETLKVKVSVKNASKVDGEEVVQLYIRDLVGSVTRPVKELKGFKKLMIKAGETKEVSFDLTEDDLSFYRRDMTFGTEPGDFKVYVGTNSRDVKEADFMLM
ncbi:beta-glucosidase BglX [Cytophagales bacterium RKSG123]|nr:beta-glucosidase BglX [Xanthovirga aplysinae]